VAEAAEQQTNDVLEKPATNTAELARQWNAEISTAEKQHSKWHERAKKTERIYNDERDLSTGRARKFNILWSNVETQRPAVYMQTPKCQAVRRYRDRDPLARFCSMLIERTVQTSCELYDFDHTMDQAVRDRLVVGRGQAWVFYEPTIVGQGEDEALAYENVYADYLPWQDFLHSVSRTWSDVWWVGRRFYKTRRELKKWLQEKGLDPNKANAIKLDYSVEGSKSDDGLKDERNKAQIWEIWDKRGGKVRFVAPGSGEESYLGDLPPKPQFRDFFPCPRPLLSTTTPKSLMPTPDYALYQDQAEELNQTQARIAVLTKALRVAGWYNASNKDIRLVLEGADNEMIPVENWAMFAEGGGKGNIEWFPVEQVAIVLEKLYLIRDQAKQTLYEVSGIGDILRGNTDPDETATAQGIKAKWGSLRVRRIQKDVQRFAADIMRLKAEVISEQFGERSILQMAGVDQELLAKYVPMPPPPQMPPQAQQLAQQNPAAAQQLQQQMAQQQQQQQAMAIKQFIAEAMKLLRDDTARNFRIDVESDSTLEPDQQEEKQTAVEFMTAIGAFMKEGQPLVMSGPEGAKLFGEMLLFATRRFDNVDQLEQVIEQAVEAWSKPKPPAPDPEMMKVEAQIKGKQAELKMKQEGQQADLGMKKEMHQLDMTAKVQEVKLDAAVSQMEARQRAQEGQQKLQLQAAQGEQQLRQGEQQAALAERQGEQKMNIAERMAQFKKSQTEGAPPE